MPRKKKSEKKAEEKVEKETVKKVVEKVKKKKEGTGKKEKTAEITAKLEEAEKETKEVTKEAEKEAVAAEEELREIKKEFPMWKPKTRLGREVQEGKIKTIDEILDSGKKILEPEIVDVLIPDLKSELMHIGGRKGKGGGIKRIPIKITAVMHRSGRRFTTKSLAAVGNEAGIVGLGRASALEGRNAIEKAIRRAKMNLIKVKRGCGSWECECGEPHSIPYRTIGKAGSVKVVLMPAPKGLGLVADDESKKIFRLAGIKDIWVKTKGNTQMRVNLITAVFNALKNLYVYERGEKKEK